MKIDGKEINKKIGESLLEKILEKKINPSLGILCVGEDPASKTFVNVKKSFGEKYGFQVNLVTETELSNVNDLEEYKERIITTLTDLQKENDAVILQLPLPGYLKKYTDEILKVIQKEKDVDNLNNGNFEAPIVLALKEVFNFLQNENVNLKNLNFALVGVGQVVGLPIKNFLIGENYNLQIIKEGEEEKLKYKDVVISGVGIANLIKSDNVKDGSILIDYGCSFFTDENGNVKMAGDFEFSCYSKARFYTPVPGCMGPLVVACLFANVLKSANVYSS